MSSLAPSFSRSVLTQGINFVQSNDLVYRTSVELLGFAPPLYLSARNEDERRETAIELGITSTVGFVFTPLYVLALNKLMGKMLLNNNTAFFQLNWASLDPGNQQLAIHQLHHHLNQINNRLEQPNWFDKIGFIQKGLVLHKNNLTKALSLLETVPDNASILKRVYQAKRSVLLTDLLLSASILTSVTPIKNWVSKHIVF